MREFLLAIPAKRINNPNRLAFLFRASMVAMWLDSFISFHSLSEGKLSTFTKEQTIAQFKAVEI